MDNKTMRKEIRDFCYTHFSHLTDLTVDVIYFKEQEVFEIVIVSSEFVNYRNDCKYLHGILWEFLCECENKCDEGSCIYIPVKRSMWGKNRCRAADFGL